MALQSTVKTNIELKHEIHQFLSPLCMHPSVLKTGPMARSTRGLGDDSIHHELYRMPKIHCVKSLKLITQWDITHEDNTQHFTINVSHLPHVSRHFFTCFLCLNHRFHDQLICPRHHGRNRYFRKTWHESFHHFQGLQGYFLHLHLLPLITCLVS